MPVSQLSGLLPARYTASERLKNFPTELSLRRIAELADDPDAVIAAFPVLGRPAAQDQTDGLRLTFSNQEVVHLRPSGNAPELRCYTEADTPERARALNRDCLEIMAGWRE